MAKMLEMNVKLSRSNILADSRKKTTVEKRQKQMQRKVNAPRDSDVNETKSALVYHSSSK
jgi:hypothetical protein